MFRVVGLELLFSIFSVFSDMLDFSVFGVLLGCSDLLDWLVLLVVEISFFMMIVVPAFSPSFSCGLRVIRSWMAMLHFFEIE